VGRQANAKPCFWSGGRQSFKPLLRDQRRRRDASDSRSSGNVTGDGARAYTCDAENRIVSVGGLSSESYSYDAKNHQVKKVVGGVVTHYIWEGDQVIAEYERGGGDTSATGTRYYHQDRLSTRIITGNAGAVVGTTDQLPFGEEIGVSGAGEKHKFTSYERDGALDYAVNRHYDPQQGRFNQVDPLGIGASSLADPQSLNLYAYSANDPVNYADPSGAAFTPASVSEGDRGDFEFGRGGGGIGFYIDGVPVSSRLALNFINHGLAEPYGAGVYGNGSLIVMDLFGRGTDGYEFIGQQAFFDPSMLASSVGDLDSGGEPSEPAAPDRDPRKSTECYEAARKEFLERENQYLEAERKFWSLNYYKPTGADILPVAGALTAQGTRLVIQGIGKKAIFGALGISLAETGVGYIAYKFFSGLYALDKLQAPILRGHLKSRKNRKLRRKIGNSIMKTPELVTTPLWNCPHTRCRVKRIGLI
jgi:RHS repeat-associated protein